MTRKLTVDERRLLKNPPGRDTWKCSGTYSVDTWENGKPTSLTKTCGVVVSGHLTECWLCHTQKSESSELLWPEYIDLCQRINHTPGERFPPRPEPAPLQPRRRRKR